jgi:hypothetical protein
MCSLMGYTPLHSVAQKNHVYMVWLLVAKGNAKLNEEVENGNDVIHPVSALQAARWAGSDKVVNFFFLGSSWKPRDVLILDHYYWLTP